MKRRVTVKSSLMVLVIVAFLLMAAIAKLFYVAISDKVDGVDLKKFASSRNEKTKILHASRGSIYDSNGDALALSVNSYKLIAYLDPKRTTDINNPQHVVDKEKTAKALAPILDMEEEKILEYLNKDAYQVEFGSKGKNLTEIVKKQIDDLELAGIDFIESTQRYYKMNNFASYVIGYAKVQDDGSIQGELGLESYFNEELSGTDGYITYESDAYGYPLPNVPSVNVDAVSGENLYLTIDSNIQLIAENAINNLTENYDFDFALISIIDAKTGAIVASATNPSFDPNNLNTLTEYLNPLVSYTYEPGSTMKIFSWASAIEEGVYNSEETYKSGSIKVADVTINDFNKVGWGNITFDRGFAYSSNVGATLLAQKLGKEKLYDYYTKYGFGKKTGIELSAEATGEIDFTWESELATAAFGQGVTITPIQMLQALTSIANDGVMLKPYLVSKIVNQNGDITYEKSKTEIGKVLSKSTTDKMKELMYLANYDGLSNMWQPSNVKMLIKTGTAQIPSSKGGYLDGQYDNIYSLAGIFPDDNPQYIIYTAIKRIVGTQRNFANVITKVVDEVASYANLTSSDENIKNKIVTLGQYRSQKTEEIKEQLSALNLNVITLGSGSYIINQYPDAFTKVVEGSKVFLLTNKNDYLMPDLTNYSLSEAATFAKLVGINFSYTGYGYVSEQSIEKDTLINNQSLKVVLKKE